MDQDSGRESRRSAPRRDGRAARPKHQLEEQPPAPQVNPLPLPLPRRSAQAHIEPQLRRPRGSGTGTPFNPFAATDEAGDGKAVHSTNGDGKKADGKRGDGKRGDAAPEPADGPKGTTASTPAAAFKKGTRQGRRRRPPAS